MLAVLVVSGFSVSASSDGVPLPTNPFGDPTGANDWTGRPSAQRPEPVILVHGTFGDKKSLLDDLSAEIVAEGFCVSRVPWEIDTRAAVRGSAGSGRAERASPRGCSSPR